MKKIGISKTNGMTKIPIVILGLFISQIVAAASFQVQAFDAAGIGNYQAGSAASAENASTNFYNPAGLALIHNQQMILGGAFQLTDYRYRGTVSLGSLSPASQPQLFYANAPATAQGGAPIFLPNFHYAAPLSDSIVFGISFVTPFNAKTDYGTNALTRYAATLSTLYVMDLAPSLGFAITPKFSFGAGLDIEHLYAEFDSQQAVSQTTLQSSDTLSKNSGNRDSYGYHVGGLYAFSDNTRIGLNYHSQVVHHLRGNSYFSGPLANAGAGGVQNINRLYTSITLPPTTTLSVFHTFNPTWDVMGSVSYTQWSVFKQIILKNISTIQNGFANNTASLAVQSGYSNSWNYAVGTNYHANEKFLLRAGLGYDQSPVNTNSRNVQLPDVDRVALAVGGHYQMSKSIGFDLGWTHFFMRNASIATTQSVGDQVTTLNGSVKNNEDIYGAQIKWDIF